MAKTKQTLNISNIETLPDLVRILSIIFDDLLTQFNGKLDFDENIRTKLVSTTFPIANQSLTIVHNLQRTPQGYINVGSNVPATLYNSNGAGDFTDTVIILKSTAVARVQLLIF